jgi:hypothetical protein
MAILARRVLEGNTLARKIDGNILARKIDGNTAAYEGNARM